jgi:hypothetical protein
MRDLPTIKFDVSKPEKFGNLAEKLDKSERQLIAEELISLIGVDEQSMSDWLAKAEDYLNTVTAEGNDAMPQNREQEGTNEQGAPATEMTLTAVIQFSARATDALLGEPDLAKASEPGGEGVAAWVSSQLRTEDPNWITDTDPLIVHMSVTGLAWRKRTVNREEKSFHTSFRTCKDVILNVKHLRNIERAPRITDQFTRYPYEIRRSIERKHWIDYEPDFDEADPQAPKNFYECDAWLDLDGDEIDEPWTVAISRDDKPEVVKIEPRWTAKTVTNTPDTLYFNPVIRFYPYKFLPDPDGGFMPMGFGKLLARIENSADRLLASISDTAKTESENGGLMGGSGAGLPDKVEIKNNRITTIPTDGVPLEKILSMFPSKTVSAGSVQVLDKIMTLGDRLAGTLNLLENAPASMTATMARGVLDNGAQVQSAVHRRLVASMTQEFRQFVNMAKAYDMLPDALRSADSNAVAVTADPQLATEMHRSALLGFHMEIAKEFGPLGAVDVRAVLAEVYRLARVPNGQRFVLPPQPPQATPKEKMQGAVALMKHQTEKIKVTGAVAVQLTQALKNLVDAGGGMVNTQMATLQMAQLEHAVNEMIGEATNAGRAFDGMDQQSSDQGPAGLPTSAGATDNSNIPGGGNGAPNNSGPGGGLQ